MYRRMHTKTVVLRVRGTIRYWRYVSGEVERDIIAEALYEGQKRGVITLQEIRKRTAICSRSCSRNLAELLHFRKLARYGSSGLSGVEHLTLLVGKESVALALIRHFGSLKGLSSASFQERRQLGRDTRRLLGGIESPRRLGV